MRLNNLHSVPHRAPVRWVIDFLILLFVSIPSASLKLEHTTEQLCVTASKCHKTVYLLVLLLLAEPIGHFLSFRSFACLTQAQNAPPLCVCVPRDSTISLCHCYRRTISPVLITLILHNHWRCALLCHFVPFFAFFLLL